MLKLWLKSAILLLLCMLIVQCVTRYTEKPNRPGDIVLGQNFFKQIKVFYEIVLKNIENRKPVVVMSQGDTPQIDPKKIYVFLDGESYGPPENKTLLDLMLYLGAPLKKTKKNIYIPFASLSFIEKTYSPLLLTKPIPQQRNPSYFAAYLASNCVPRREQAFDKLVKFSQEHQLGKVHALGSCHGSHPELRIKTAQKNSDYQDEAIDFFRDYKYALVFENSKITGYTTEKIVAPFLSGSAVPIYWGDEAVFNIFNSSSFLFVKDDISEILNLKTLNDAKRQKMLEAPKLAANGLYYFTWHPDIIAIWPKGKTTLQDVIKEALLSFNDGL